jgi:DNA-binding beta-propeller fold protein YncE
MIRVLTLVVLAFTDPTIHTGAGTGQQGFGGDGGPATQARLDQPFDVAFDARGNVFFPDTFNYRIRTIDGKTGAIRTVVGSGQRGHSGDGGPALDAKLDEPYGIVLDPIGNLFFADRLNFKVRKVDAASGLISTVAGTGSPVHSGDGGPARAAGLVEPNGVALDRLGRYLFIADVGAHRVRKIDLATGLITTFAGTGRPRHEGDGGLAAQASIWGARAVDVGPDGTVYIVEREGNSVRTVDPGTGLITTVAGTGVRGYSGDGGPALLATFSGPKEIAVDRSGNLWIVDTENHAIRFIDARTRIVSTLAGTGQAGGDGDGGPAARARLNRPHGVAARSDGEVWIGDTNNHRLRVVQQR